MAEVYYADAVTHVFVGSHSVPDDYKLQVNESFDNPSGLQGPVKLTATGWIAATDEEHKAYLEAQQKDWLAQHPQPNQPADNKGDQALNLLGQQLAQVEAQQATLASSVNALGQMVAKAQAPKQA